ncbi:hypothetical protein [Pseudomonas brassicacearum]|uniref:hypothetical protein n=1 Tax=Pseudomonas brassicacearum TaxID=930166 RepID=UPI001269AA79|nr:hypothetical protein [Pseudomonas brassicacearum]
MESKEILKAMEVLRKKFKSHYDQWIRLKQDQEFQFDLDHNSPIRELYADGVMYVRGLLGALDTQYVGSSMLMDEYVESVSGEVPDKELYDACYLKAKGDFESNYKNNYTAQYMLAQYIEQWGDIQRVKQFLAKLESSSAYRLLRSATPMDVIKRHAREWEQDVQLHSKIDENGLRSQLVLELKRSGFLATSETHAREGHGDIIVSRANSEGNTAGHILVVECKMWKGPAALYAAISQLCQYATPYDDDAALVVFVREGTFPEVCSTAAEELAKHEACSDIDIQSHLIKFSLALPQDTQRPIQASLLLCNLTKPRYLRSKTDAGAEQLSFSVEMESSAENVPSEYLALGETITQKFGYGPCKCYRCNQMSGAQDSYEFKHMFECSGIKIHRLFIKTLDWRDEEVISFLKRAEPPASE